MTPPQLIMTFSHLILIFSQLILTPPQLILRPPQLILTPPQLILTSPQLILTPSQLILTPSKLILTLPRLILTFPQVILTFPQLILTPPQLILILPQLILNLLSRETPSRCVFLSVFRVENLAFWMVLVLFVSGCGVGVWIMHFGFPFDISGLRVSFCRPEHNGNSPTWVRPRWWLDLCLHFPKILIYRPYDDDCRGLSRTYTTVAIEDDDDGCSVLRWRCGHGPVAFPKGNEFRDSVSTGLGTRNSTFCDSWQTCEHSVTLDKHVNMGKLAL